MADRSSSTGIIILPLLLVGAVAGSMLLAPASPNARTHPPAVISPTEEMQIVEQTIAQSLDTLPTDPTELGRAERHLLLRLNDTETRQREVAAGLYAVASRHLENADAPAAMRVAQTAADITPGSLLATQCWILCGQASAVTHPDLPLSIRYFERADELLQSRLRQHPSDQEALRLRATSGLWLAKFQDRFGRTEAAIHNLRELTTPSPLEAIQPAESRLQAMLLLSQLLQTTGESRESQLWLTTALEYGLSESVPAEAALHTLTDSARRSNPDLVDPVRIDALRLLWDSPRFVDLPEWFQVGDELASAYFFHEPRQLADFELVSRKFLKHLPAVLASLDEGTEPREGLESLYASNLVLAADSARSRGDTTEVARLVKLFEGFFDRRDVHFTSPLDRPAQRMHHIGEVYRTTMTGHVEHLRQLQSAGSPKTRF